MDKDYSKYNAQNVLDRLEGYIARGFGRKIREIYDDLSIFDWWPETLTIAHMKQMRTFLKAAIARGYTGYVCFKVGARGCANGMWAHTVPTTNGYSPDGKTLYRSFTPDYTCWSASEDGHTYLPNDDEYASCKTIKDLDRLLASQAA